MGCKIIVATANYVQCKVDKVNLSEKILGVLKKEAR